MQEGIRSTQEKHELPGVEIHSSFGSIKKYKRGKEDAPNMDVVLSMEFTVGNRTFILSGVLDGVTDSDGEGGNAAKEACDLLRNELINIISNQPDINLEDAIKVALKSVSTSIATNFPDSTYIDRILSTISFFLLEGDTVYYGHMGDSILFSQVIGSPLEQITIEHNDIFGAAIKLAGEFPDYKDVLEIYEQIKTRSSITAAVSVGLGNLKSFYPQIGAFEMQHGQLLLSITDGILKNINLEVLKRIIATKLYYFNQGEISAEQMCKEITEDILKVCNEQGEKPDDITINVVFIS